MDKLVSLFGLENIELVRELKLVNPGDNPPIGIILSRNKDELLVEYATYQMNSTLFVQKYQLYLPDREALRHQLELSLREAGE